MSAVAFITGASRGIGEHVSIGLAERGWSVALVARDQEKLSQVKDKLDSSQNQKHLVIPTDVTDERGVREAVDKTESELGPISLLFNNAGIFKSSTLELSKEEFEKVFAVNVTGAWVVLKAVAEQMRKRKQGSIYNLASKAGTESYAGVGTYCASKFAVRALNQSVFRELSGEGIRVTSINPSYVDTDMAQQAGSSYGSDEMIQKEDILKTILYLESLSHSACVQDITIFCRNAIG